VSPLRIGTRRSTLATAQAREVAALLGQRGVETELVPIVTAGDRGEVPGAAEPAGLKGLFVSEIVRSLLVGDVDLAVHSAKDLPVEQAEGIVLAAIPRRASPLDVLVWGEAKIAEAPVVGTSSLRRIAQLADRFPHYRLAMLRGNVDTRLEKVTGGELDGAVLAEAGLARLGIRPRFSTRLAPDVMVPAPGQGALAIQARTGDDATLAAIASLDDGPSRVAVEAEFALVRRLGGGCALPLGGYARTEGDDVRLSGLVATPDGERVLRARARGESAEGAARYVADELLGRGAAEILAAARGDG
jgi:hydroxymethylbilane synthase